ncbi:MAG TPA: aldehyde dehydrogenase (NADP(+)) [Candidatus Acidoferrales bacterium]|nr:aldehyde dehydrogenase (NADP(+)) [Candidatus Acidoferrales bacterium]
MAATGRSFIGFREGAKGDTTFRAYNPATGQPLDPEFQAATPEEVDLAARLAAEAFVSFRELSGAAKAEFLNGIAKNIEAATEQIVERGHLETALPKPRLQSETARTCNQLRLFAQVVQEGSWVNARIDRADPNRKPLPKPDIRSMWRPLGPVVVFSASNFPLAFSVAGGDTASAFAAGNPVIVKAHSAHPGTSQIVGEAVRGAVRSRGLHEGVFSLIFGAGTSVGTQLVQHPLIKAGGFTGSTGAGRALMNLAAARPEPIPFYGELGSTNPVFLLPGAMQARGAKIAEDLYGSFTLGAGQFCTKPGLIFFSEGKTAAPFVGELKNKVAQAPEFALLTKGISGDYDKEAQKRKQRRGLSVVAEGAQRSAANPYSASAAVYQTEISSFLAEPELSEEHFGPSTLLIEYSNKEQILEAARKLEGHLTATIHGTEEDLREFSELISILENKVGRILFNGFPTGVEVCHAMVHGGPYPASTDGRTTSVGTQAIYRFARPVCYQNLPDSALPAELKNANPLGVWRLVDGKMTQEAL